MSNKEALEIKGNTILKGYEEQPESVPHPAYDPDSDQKEEIHGECIRVDDLPSESPFDIPGSEYRKGLYNITDLIIEKAKAWGIDFQEVLVGLDDMPPSDPNCLVYLSIARNGTSFKEYFRKNLIPGGRWVCKSYMHHVKRSSKKKGTFNYSYEMAYI